MINVTKVASRFGILLFLIAVSVGNEAYAQCACSPPAYTVAQFEFADEVFVGKITLVIAKVEKGETEGPLTIELKVVETWKNDLVNTVLVMTIGEEELFEKGTEWLIYAKRDKHGNLHFAIHCCSRTKTLQRALEGKEFDTFKQMGKTKKRILVSD